MPQLKPSRAAAYLQQDMDKEISVGVCAQVSLPDPLGINEQTNTCTYINKCLMNIQETCCLCPPMMDQVFNQHRLAGRDIE